MDLFSYPDKPKRRYLTKGDKDKILKRQKYRCAKCKGSLDRIPIHFDHKKPIALGGSDNLRNRQALCPICHAKKTREDRSKIAKKKRHEKERDPLRLGPLFSPPPKRRKKEKSIWDI